MSRGRNLCQALHSMTHNHVQIFAMNHIITHIRSRQARRLLLAAILLATFGNSPAQTQPGNESAAAAASTLPEVTATRPQVIIHTSMGDIRLQLFADRAPATVRNFLQYARDDFYSGTIFHRVISGFMIQGGGFTVDLERKRTNDPIINEADNGLKNTRGTVAMARTNNPNSATSQFFINHVTNRALDHRNKNSAADWGYAVFGEVIQGMEVVDAIAMVDTAPQPPLPRDVPVEPVVIDSVEVITAD